MAEEKSAPAEKSKPVRKALPVITQNRLFAGLILIVTVAFLLSLVGLGLLAVFGKDPLTALQTKFADACDFTLKVTLGALSRWLQLRVSFQRAATARERLTHPAPLRSRLVEKPYKLPWPDA